MLLSKPDTEMYLADMFPPPIVVDPVEEMSYAAATAFAHMVDDCATLEDLNAYRAWMTYCRLTHMSDAELVGARAVAEDCARKLGVA
jgi:hypothetical protein